MQQAKRPGQSPPPAETWDLGMLVPFPELPVTISIPANDPGSKYKTKELCPTSQKEYMMTTNPHTTQLTSTSAPIPFPKDHVKKTPSELQIDLNRRQAEYDIALMKARIGKHSRARDYPHPSTYLTRKPVQKTEKKDKEKEARVVQVQQLVPRGRGNDGWELAKVSSANSQNLRKSDRHHILNKLKGVNIDDDDDDDIIFSLDL